MNKKFYYQCKNCKKLSEPLKIDEYTRLEINQNWICKDCKLTDTQVTVRKLTNGNIVQNNDF